MDKKGFTLLELLAVVTILGILATMLTARLDISMADARLAATRLSMTSIMTGLERYRQDVGRYPDELEDLLEPPRRVAGWDGPYLIAPIGGQLLDAWGRAYLYESPGINNPYTYDLWSLGPDSGNTRDNIENWR